MDRRHDEPTSVVGQPQSGGSFDLARGSRRFQRNDLRDGQKPEETPPVRPRGIFDPALLRAAIPQAFRKLDPVS